MPGRGYLNPLESGAMRRMEGLLVMTKVVLYFLLVGEIMFFIVQEV